MSANCYFCNILNLQVPAVKSIWSPLWYKLGKEPIWLCQVCKKAFSKLKSKFYYWDNEAHEKYQLVTSYVGAENIVSATESLSCWKDIYKKYKHLGVEPIVDQIQRYFAFALEKEKTDHLVKFYNLVLLEFNHPNFVKYVYDRMKREDSHA